MRMDIDKPNGTLINKTHTQKTIVSLMYCKWTEIIIIGETQF